MTPASPLQSRQPAWQPVSAAVPRAVRGERPSPVRAIKRVPLFSESSATDEDEFKMNLGDLPRTKPGLDLDGFQPSLTSRVLDLFDRLRKR